MASRPLAAAPPRTLGMVVVALATGLAVAWLDSRPGWDDTGVTVGLLVLGAAIAAAVAGRWPWLWALLVGGPLPLVEIPATGSLAPLAALLFTTVAASLGILARRAIQAGSRAT